MTEAQKQWIDSASYEQLLSRWRFAPVGDPMFVEAGDYYKEVMLRRKQEAGHHRDLLEEGECVVCECDRLRAENERLRDVLSDCADLAKRGKDGYSDVSLRRIREQASAALDDSCTVTVRADGDILREEPE